MLEEHQHRKDHEGGGPRLAEGEPHSATLSIRRAIRLKRGYLTGIEGKTNLSSGAGSAKRNPTQGKGTGRGEIKEKMGECKRLAMVVAQNKFTITVLNNVVNKKA